MIHGSETLCVLCVVCSVAEYLTRRDSDPIPSSPKRAQAQTRRKKKVTSHHCRAESRLVSHHLCVLIAC